MSVLRGVLGGLSAVIGFVLVMPLLALALPFWIVAWFTRVLATWREALGRDVDAYRGHVYRMLNFSRALAGDERAGDALAVAAVFHDLGIWTEGPSQSSTRRYRSISMGSSRYQTQAHQDKGLEEDHHEGSLNLGMSSWVRASVDPNRR